MDETLYLLIGITLLLLVFYDFFFTTISASGAAFLTKWTSMLLHRLLHLSEKVFGRKVHNLSGVWINFPMLVLWLMLFWLGLFMVFSSNPEAVVSSSGKVASDMERFYFTGYIVSTLGLGNFKPITPFFEILTSSFSLFGFVFITTSMTYLISISSAVISKRTISLFIRNIGKSPQEVVGNLLKMNSSLRIQQFVSLQEMIDRHSNNHQTYPVIHFYNAPKRESSLSVNLAVMDEAISMILSSESLKDLHQELQPLRNSITNFLEHVQQKFSLKAGSIPVIHWDKLSLPDHDFDEESLKHKNLESRRKILGGLLKGESWSWKEVYPESALEKKG